MQSKDIVHVTVCVCVCLCVFVCACYLCLNVYACCVLSVYVWWM